MATIITSTSNKDIDYIDKDFSSVEDAIITFANTNFGPGSSSNRVWSDFNASSFSRNWLDIVAFISDVMIFYFDNQATQSYLQTATVQSAVELIAAQFGFVPATASSASGTATFTFTSGGTVPRGTRVQASNGSQFFTTTDLVAASSGNFLTTVLQGQLNSQTFTAVGLQNEELNLAAQNIVVDLTNSNPLDISPQVTVNGNSYTLVSTFILSNGTDTPAVTDSTGSVIGGGGRVFLLNTRADGTKYVEFGDGTFGRQLLPNEVVNINYRSGGGTVGNIPAQTLNTLLDTFSFVSSVTNTTAFSGGTDAQTIAQLQQLIPASLRSLDRAVTLQDYSDILVANFPQVLTASAETNTTNPGVDLNVYVVSTAATVTNITDNTPLLNTLTNFLDLRKMVTTQFSIRDAFGIDMLFTIEAHLTNTASQSVVKAAITTALQNYFNLQTGGASGTGIGFATDILIEDISALLKTITGITRFEFRKFTYNPRVDKEVIGLTTTYDVSNVMIFPNVSQSEWLLAAAGPVTETTGVILFHNQNSATFTYNSGTGQVNYTSPILPETLASVAPGDEFRDGAAANFTILAVDSRTNSLYLSTGLPVNTTSGNNAGGSIRSGASSFESYKVFKKILATTTNLSINSISDTNQDFSVLTSTGTELSPNVLLDNSQVLIPNQYSTGLFFLEDSAGNIWDILANDSDTITTGATSINDSSVNTVASGTYKIVPNLTSHEVLFNGTIFNINYNNHNTVWSIGAQFNNIGTIGNSFQLSKTQTNVGNLGVPLDLISYDSSTGLIQLNNQPDLNGISSNDFLIDSSGQVFRITAVDNRQEPAISYDSSHYNADVILSGNGASPNFVLAQGFKVAQTTTYPVVSWYLQKQGNIQGNVFAQIVNDNAGLPNLSSVVATSTLLSSSSLSQMTFNEITAPNFASGYTKTVFNFTTPPTLSSGTQYHLVLRGDSGYNSTQKNDIKTFDNDTAASAYTYNSVNGVVQYANSVGLSSVVPGNYIKDMSGNLFQVLTVNAAGNTVTIGTGQTFVQDSPVFSATAGSGSIYAKDSVYVGVDSVSHTYPDGVFETFNGSVWSNYSPTSDAIFSVEGPNTITVNSNLTPVLGKGATVSSRYYDDNNEISLIVGISSGFDTFAADVDAFGKGTVAGIPNSNVDTFTFRTSQYIDDMTNFRANEIPQLNITDLNIKLFGGVG